MERKTGNRGYKTSQGHATLSQSSWFKELASVLFRKNSIHRVLLQLGSHNNRSTAFSRYQMKTILLSTFLLSFFLFSIAPRCELGTSAVYEMSHWVSFASVPNPVTVKMLINVESHPYLELLETRYTPTPIEIREVVIHFRQGDQGQRGLLITWVVDRPLHLVASFTFAAYETKYVSPSFSLLKGEEQREFLKSTTLYPAENPLVRSIASNISDDFVFRNRVEMARAAYDWIRRNTEYDPGWTDTYDAIAVLREGHAVCEGAAYAFSTLCRAMDIPARVHYGNIIEPSTRGIFWKKHCWAEFWDGFNWQPVDPTLGYFGSLSIHPRVHGSFGLWEIDVRSSQGIVWPLNKDGEVLVSGVGLDWSRFVGYRYTPFAYAWLLQDLLQMTYTPFLLSGVLAYWRVRKKDCIKLG